MIRARCSTTSAEALRRVFVESYTSLSPPQCTQRITWSISQRALKCPYTRRQVRDYAQVRPTFTRALRDEEIQSRMVVLVDSDNRLQPPAPLSRVLYGLNRSSQLLVQVAHKDPEEPPICRAMDKKAFLESEREKMKPKKPSITIKELELNWAIDPNDLGHRLDKLQQFLEKGMRVEMVLAGKRKGRKATQAEAENVLKKIRERVEQIDGARESKEMEGKMLGQCKLTFEGR